ncbi:CHAD domain-containing protein [Zavarzinia compransoris]|uniref:CYTH and CHAD domain-containing protein n=1 Tax=Zavarzinia marina TaxID=2911065 RepID=UPI001F30E1A3|nr:CHAD domain-containing protein [Zavarzinia marina]MCF4166110.1 CHAD domain-containing protein [Zavarzinia marina]
MSSEVELKLAVDPDDLPRLRRLPLLTRGNISPARNRSLKTIYFDTAERSLAKGKVTLRVREDGRKRIHGVKVPVKSLAGLATRREWEIESRDTVPDLDAFPPGTVDSVLDTRALGADALEAVFETEFKRNLRHLALGTGGEVEVAVDEGAIRAAGKGEAVISEIEFELKAGDPADLFALALAVAEQVPVRVLVESKAERGSRLATGRVAKPVKAEKLSLHEDMSACDAFAAIVQDCTSHWLANVEAVLDGTDVEGVHQMRVALRRLRSGFKVFRRILGPEPSNALSDEVKWLANSLGPARDWDVFIGDVAGPVFKALGPDARFDRIMLQADSERRIGYGLARGAIEDERHTRLALTLGRFVAAREWREGGETGKLDGPVKKFAADVLDAHFKRVRQRGRRIMQLEAEALHGLRIEIKRLRYALEFFGSLFDAREVRRFLDGLAGLQDFLGELNDMAVSQRLIVTLGRSDSSRAFAEGVLTGFYGAALERKRKNLRSQWGEVLVQDRFWRD